VASRPEVSVVIPTKDRWSRLERTLLGALRQEGVGVEVVVVDDGGSDGTPERIAAMGESRVVVKRNSVNRGPATSLNVGIDASRADWVAFLDDDDLWAPRKLATQLDAMEAAGATWGYCAVATVDDRLEVVAGAEPPVPAADIREEVLRSNPIKTPSIVVVRRDELERVGGFDERLRHAHDWDLYLRLARAARAAACPEVLVAYVDHGGGLHTREPTLHLPEFEYLARKHAEAGVRLDGVVLSRWVAGLYRRRGNRRAAARAYLWGARRFRSPGNIVRAAGLLFGERGMRFAARGRPPVEAVSQLNWLAGYR
jgi:glycosyltransferase involved in cell wall biosynthesis